MVKNAPSDLDLYFSPGPVSTQISFKNTKNPYYHKSASVYIYTNIGSGEDTMKLNQ